MKGVMKGQGERKNGKKVTKTLRGHIDEDTAANKSLLSSWTMYAHIF